MKTYISILRGINVSGYKMINMNDLKDIYVKLNFKNVQTYIQSGNVVLQSGITDEIKISGQIEQEIFRKYNFKVPVIIRTLEELKKANDKNPFLKEKNIDLEKLYITFLSAEPVKEFKEKLKDIDYSPDKFIISKKEVYGYCPNGFGRTKLNNNFYENKLKVIATSRNIRTVKELIKIAENINNS